MGMIGLAQAQPYLFNKGLWGRARDIVLQLPQQSIQSLVVE